MNKDFEILHTIPTKRFSINGIVYNRDDVYKGRFTKVTKECELEGKLHVRWNTPQRAFLDGKFTSVNPEYHSKAHEALCSGFVFNEADLVYIKD